MYHSFLIHSSADGHLGASMSSYYKQCCDEHWGACVSFNSGFLGVYARQWDWWVIWEFYFQFFKESPHFLHSGCTSCISTNSVRGFLFLYTLSSIYCFLTAAILTRCEMVPHCGFDLHFSDNEWCWASFRVFVSHLYVEDSRKLIFKILFSNSIFSTPGNIYNVLILSSTSKYYWVKNQG